jgi:hypothetical protein
VASDDGRLYKVTELDDHVDVEDKRVGPGSALSSSSHRRVRGRERRGVIGRAPPSEAGTISPTTSNFYSQPHASRKWHCCRSS